MKTFKNILKALFCFAIAVILIFSSAVFWVWHHPLQTWQFIESKFLPADLRITWQSLDVSVHRLEVMNFYFDIRVGQLMIHKKEPLLSLPLQEVWLKASVFPLNKDKQVRFQELFLLGVEEIYFRPSPSPQPGPQKNPFQIAENSLAYLNWVREYIHFEKLNMDFQKVRLELQAGEIVFAATLNQEQGVWRLQSHATWARSDLMQIILSGEIPIEEEIPPGRLFKGDVVFKSKSLKTTQHIQIDSRDGFFFVQSRGALHVGKMSFVPTLEMRLDSKLAVLTFKGAARGLPGPVKSLNDIRGEIRSPIVENHLLNSKQTSFSLFFPMRLFFVDDQMRSLIATSCDCKIPKSLGIGIHGSALLEKLFAELEVEETVLSAVLKIDSVTNALLSLNLGASLDLLKAGREYRFLPRLNSVASINSFRRFRKILDLKNVLVPAPFDVLDGKIEVRAVEPIQYEERESIIPFQTAVKLNSKNQEIDLSIKTDLKLSFSHKYIGLKLYALIQSLRLELPPLTPLGGKPRVLKDPRILKKPTLASRTASEFKIIALVDIQTNRPGAIQLLSNYFKPYLPVTLQLQRSVTKDNQGFIRAEPFDAEIFRRKLHVETMEVTLSDSEKAVFPVRGRIRVQQTLYTVFIDITGTTLHPVVHFNSEPYLPEDDVISVLLYDRTRSELGGMDAATAGGFQAAVADHAIGLFGLWAFASTPIRSFNYNPVTKVYSATVALADDLSAVVGTDWENATQLELRKRVSKQWILMATWEPATATDSEQNKLQLLWEKRY